MAMVSAAVIRPTLPAASYSYTRNTCRPIFPLTILRKQYRPSYSSSRSFQILAVSNINSINQEIVRPLANYSPDMWGDRFLTLPFTQSEFESCSRQVEILKGTVKDILMTSMDDPIENILVINSLYRLGVSYHFEDEIGKQLNHLFTILPQLIESNDYNLYTVATTFLVFRSHNYKMSCDVFGKFKNIDGMFKKEVGSDIKGMISLYEASHWRMKGELILDEALSFTTIELESIANQPSSSISSNLANYIMHALEWPHQRSMSRLDARHFISFYEIDESRNDVLLNFAKYDFNRVQMLFQQELSLLTSWWKESKIASKFPYARHRMVENFLSAVIVFFEPSYARIRNIFAKGFIVLSLLDDTYDAYGLYEELQHFTNATERMDRSAMDELPVEYLKNVYEVVLNLFDEVEEEVSKDGRSYSLSYFKEEIKKIVGNYDIQARWTHKCLDLPTFDEYLDNGKWSIAVALSLSLAMIGMEEADQNAYEWLNKRQNKVVEIGGLISRLYNDIVTNEREEKSGGQVSGTACYMKQYGVSRKEAVEALKERIEDGWKDVNEGFMRPSPVSTQILLRALNVVRLADVFFKNDDGYTCPQISCKHHIAKVLIHPIQH